MRTQDRDRHLRLFDQSQHQIDWIGVQEDSAFKANSYLIQDHGAAVLVDPGGSTLFERTWETVAELCDPNTLVAVSLSHQDPDVCSSLPLWLEQLPELEVLASPRCHILVEHYGASAYHRIDLQEGDSYPFGEGAELRCLDAPFLHSPASIALYDPASEGLFTGDLYGAMNIDGELVVRDWEAHLGPLNAFHLDYMASSVAARGFARKMRNLSLNQILPQHGSIIPAVFIEAAIAYLEDLYPGLDILYPEL